jgi:DNA-binding NarL/FixJ family response regulator
VNSKKGDENTLSNTEIGSHSTREDISFRKDLITNHDLRIISLVMQGYSVRQIARQLLDSEQSIHLDLGNILQKTGAKDLFELVMFAIHYDLPYKEKIGPPES